MHKALDYELTDCELKPIASVLGVNLIHCTSIHCGMVLEVDLSHCQMCVCAMNIKCSGNSKQLILNDFSYSFT